VKIRETKTPQPRRTPPSGPGVRQLHQRRLKTKVRGGRRQGPAPDRPLRLALLASAVLTVGTIFGAAIFHVILIQSEFRLDQINKEATKEEARYEKLRLDVAQLSAPDRIVATASWDRTIRFWDPEVEIAPEDVTIGFEQGRPVSIDGRTFDTAVDLVLQANLMAPIPQAPGAQGADHDDPAAPSLAGGWAEVKPHLGTRP